MSEIFNMATPNRKSLEYECPVCNDYFKQPKLLLCGHDLCRDCLVLLCNSSVEASCPLCRCPIETVQKNVNEPTDDIVNMLPDDLAMVAVVECARILSNKQECSIHSNTSAVSFCLQCNEMFCSCCSDFHRKQKVSRHHVLEDLSSLTPVILAANREDTCTIHTDRMAELFCSFHYLPICHVCAISDHRDCTEVINLERRGKTARGELDKLWSKLYTAETTLNEALSKISYQVAEIDQSTESIVQKMEETYQRFISLAESCLTRHKECLRHSSSRKRLRILDTKEKITSLHDRVVSHKIAVNRVNQTVSGAALFEMTATLTMRIHELDLDTNLPAAVEKINVISEKIDPNTVKRFEYDLTHLALIPAQDITQSVPIPVSNTDSVLRDVLQKTFPEAEKRSYFIPPIFINKLSGDDDKTLEQKILARHSYHNLTQEKTQKLNKTPSTLTPGRVQKSCIPEEMIQQHVLFCLRELAKEQKEVMCVLSQLNFSDYPGEHCYLAAARPFGVPIPDELQQKHKHGDFDILIIHRYYGLIVGEIRFISLQPQSVYKPLDVDKDFVSTIERSIDQLNKSEITLRLLTEDLFQELSVYKTLILPHVTRSAFQRVLSSHGNLKQALCQCLNVADESQILDLCMLSDNLTNQFLPWNVQQLKTWWTSLVSISKDTHMTSDLYLNLLTRFLGQITSEDIYSMSTSRVETRKEGQGVSFVWKRMAKIHLTYSQVDLLTRDPPRVLLTGAPGVGKSVMLAIKGKQWLRAGQRVHIVSISQHSLAASHALKHVIQETARLDKTANLADDAVLLYTYDFENNKTDVDKATHTMIVAAGGKELNIICDEFWIIDSLTPRLQWFIKDLCTQVPKVRLWAASIFHYQSSAELQQEQLTIPLRFPQVVLSEVNKAVKYSDLIYQYTMTTLSPSYDGPNIIHVNHLDLGHTGRWPQECYKCGQCIADILLNLGVGAVGVTWEETFKNRAVYQSFQMVGTSAECGHFDIVTLSQKKRKTVGADTDILQKQVKDLQAVLNPDHDLCRPISTTNVLPANVDIKTSNTDVINSSPTLLQYRDVFVLTRNADLSDDMKDVAGRVTSRADAVVRGLRDSGIPVRVIRKGHESSDVCDTAVAQSDMVTVACYRYVYGLERKVVVFLPHRQQGGDDEMTDAQLETHSRLRAMSLCTSQLVVVDVPLTNKH